MNKYVTNLTLPNGTNVLIKDLESRTNLSNEIRRATAKETELEGADTNLRNDLTTETNARKQSDTALQQNINAEIAKIHSNITGIENKNTEQDDELSTLRTMLSSPYNFKGDVASISSLPASGEVNDTYYVQDVKYKVTWTGSAWVQSSINEADYQTELGELKGDIENIVRGNVSLGKITNGYYLIKTNGNLQPYSGWSTTDYIDLDGIDKIYIDWGKASGYNCYYDKNKSYLSGVDIYEGNNIIEVIENARYIRLSNETAVLEKASICFDTSGGYLLNNKISKNEIIGGDLLRGYGWQYSREHALNVGYQTILSYYKEDPSIIPIFVSTDNHMYSPQHAQRCVNNLDEDGMEITNINLGDCVVDNWADGKFPEIYKNIRYIKNYIGVCGNHDKQDGTKTTEYYLNRIFTTTNYQKKHIKGSSRCCYSVKVDKQSVKYIVLDLYYVPEGGGIDVSMPTEIANWLIDELTSDIGYDVILLNHNPFTSRNQHRDGSLQTWTDEHSIYDNIFSMLKDRKNKRNGTITDSDGIQHNYDFTNCKDDLLFILHGHAHEELYLIEDNLFSYVCDWEGGKRNTFILYDRKVRRFIAFVVEETTVKEMLSLTIN